MAGPTRQTPDLVALENALRERPESFEFFEALRRIECAHPDRPRLGRSAKPAEDAVRLCQTPSLAFAPRTVSSRSPMASHRACMACSSACSGPMRRCRCT